MAAKEFLLDSGRIAVVRPRSQGGRREGPGRCACGLAALFLCDYRAPGAKRGTCDRALCGRCRHVHRAATHDHLGVDYCAEHDAIVRDGAEAADENEEWGFSAPGDARATPAPPR